jgi:hypothetical protein
MNKYLNWFIIANFVMEILYCCWQVFYVLAPPGTFGPLGGTALTMNQEMFWARRAYAVEAWIAISGLSIYLAIMADKRK